MDVIGTDEFEEWFLGLERKDAEGVSDRVEMLADRGVGLGFP